MLNKDFILKPFFLYLIIVFFIPLINVAEPTSPDILVEIDILLNKEIYQKSDFGEAPQIAIWMKDLKHKFNKSIYVTRRTAKEQWVGKIECPTSLPIWKNNVKEKKGLDAFTSATPKNKRIITKLKLKKDLLLEFFLEINVSGDFNHHFPYRDSNGMPDPQVNGQPSLIYSTGPIKVNSKNKIKFKLIGRSDQWNETKDIILDTKGITSAKKLIKFAFIRCH